MQARKQPDRCALTVRDRFHPLSIGAHWLTVLLLVAVYVLIELHGAFPKGSGARELTKHFESVRRGALAELAQEIASGEPLRGEIVLLIGPPSADAAEVSEASLDERLRAAMAKNSVKDAAAIVAGETGQPRRRVYARALQLAGERAD